MEHIIAKLLQDFEQGKMSRRQLIQSLTLTATAVSAAGVVPAAAAAVQAAAPLRVPGPPSPRVPHTPLKAVGISHINFRVKDFTKIRDFYVDLFETQVSTGDFRDHECHVKIGETWLTLTNSKEPGTPMVDHVALKVEPWEQPSVEEIDPGAPTLGAQLKLRGLKLVNRNTILDPEGFKVQFEANSMSYLPNH